MNTKETLQLLTTSELMDELLRRFDTAIFAGMRDQGKRGEPPTEHIFEIKRYRGDYHTALGLLSRTDWKINRDFEKNCQQSDDL